MLITFLSLQEGTTNGCSGLKYVIYVKTKIETKLLITFLINKFEKGCNLKEIYVPDRNEEEETNVVRRKI
jgi:hypothetical protein